MPDAGRSYPILGAMLRWLHAEEELEQHRKKIRERSKTDRDATRMPLKTRSEGT